MLSVMIQRGVGAARRRHAQSGSVTLRFLAYRCIMGGVRNLSERAEEKSKRRGIVWWRRSFDSPLPD